MRVYELTYIVHPDVSDDDRAALQKQIETLTHAGGGRVQKVVDWGRRRLAYRIKDQREGHYIHMLIEMDQPAIPELERTLKFTENVLRYLLVRAED